MKKSDKKVVVPGGVDEYIKNCPEEVRSKLEEIRAAIQTLAPGSIETVSYFRFPGYSYEGYDYNGMFAWFSFKEPYIRLHIRPPVIKNLAQELEKYPTSTGIVKFPMDEEIPLATVKKLVQASLDIMRS